MLPLPELAPFWVSREKLRVRCVEEAVIEGLQANVGEDDIVDAVEVTAVSTGHDAPVLDVRDGMFNDPAYGV